MVKERDRPPQPRRRRSGKWIALALAILVNLAFVGVLVFSVTWRNPPAPAVSAELYAPPVRTPVPPKPEPPKPEPPKPEPPKPEPPKPEPPKPEPPKPPPKVEKPDPHEAEIALKAKQDEERKRREEAERVRADTEKRKREAEEKLRADAKREADARERQQRETQALRDQAEREARLRADNEAKARVAAERALVQAENTARARAEADWIRRIQAKVRGNVILPPDIAGNPEAIFDVVQLPTGEILDVQLRKSSGVRSYDDAVQRAILKSSPLPRPERADLFQRTLTLKFRPVD
jgi:colicin import membrane protein